MRNLQAQLWEAKLKQVVAEKDLEILAAQSQKDVEVLAAKLKQLEAEKQAEAAILGIKLSMAATDNLRMRGLLHMRGLLGELQHGISCVVRHMCTCITLRLSQRWWGAAVQ
jgi:hypothetical protein